MDIFVDLSFFLYHSVFINKGEGMDELKTWKWRIYKTGNTIKSFAQLVGVNKSQISQYVTGVRMPSLRVFDKIEKYLQSIENK